MHSALLASSPRRQSMHFARKVPCRELGMSMTTAFVIYAKKVAREHRIPFEVSVDPFYSDENMAHLRASIASLDAGHGQSHDLKEPDEAE